MLPHRSWGLVLGLGLFLGLLAGSAFAVGGAIPQLTTICFQCSSDVNGSPNPQCPADAFVDMAHVYRGPCAGKCFTRAGLNTHPTAVIRGCTTSQWGLPDPLPPDGCYTWDKRSEVWCVCGTNGCNGMKMGEAGNVTFESYVESQQHTPGDNAGQRNDTVLPPSVVPGASGVLQCWQCVSDLNGQHYSQCPLYEAVDVTRAYIGNCTGRCFMHNTTDRDGREVMSRGCTDSQWGLPDPLPADGCYKWFSDVWCVCATDGCNGVALGTPTTDAEFDGYRQNPDTNHAATSTTTSRDLLFLFYFFIFLASLTL